MQNTINLNIEEITKYLEEIPGIRFAYLFGSYAEGKELPMSDVDIAIYCEKELELLELGRKIVDLEKITGKKIDLVQMNGLYKKSPVLAYEIITTGKELIEKDKNEHCEFKTSSYKYYFDTEYLRKEYDYYFRKRLRGEKLG